MRDTSSTTISSCVTIRKLEIDLQSGFGRHWHGGDAFASQFLNALSMGFPVGEQVFIDTVRDCVNLLPDSPAHAQLRNNADQFMGQEATHRHVHGLYNAELARQGLVNRWQHWAAARIAHARRLGVKPRHLVAFTAAFEHLTAVMADHLLRHGNGIDRAEPKLRMLWMWHAAEETEHRAVAFDLYLALRGNYPWRVRWYVYALLVFSRDVICQTVLNLWHDRSLFKPTTWWHALRFFCGRQGLVWHCTGPLLRYFRRDFHPDQEAYTEPQQQAHMLAKNWFRDNAASFRVVK